MPLTIRLTKISPTHHRFEYTRTDGSGESFDLETKTYLFHDLVHFAVESEAGLKNSFYGKLAKGQPYASLSMGAAMENTMETGMEDEAVMTEMIVGPIGGVIKDAVTPEEFLAGMKNMLDAHGQELPPWLTVNFVLRVQKRMRELQGHWNGTPFGETMELSID